ncbi:MAG: Hsp70 family protein [Firmicutes bacterium]|nr:Hsp70 family protein [Bacillota bacterium]
MDRFFGFDLGDAESAVARLHKEDQVTPEMLTVVGEQSFITAYAQLSSGELLIGEKACYADGAVKRKLRFKSRFLSDSTSANDVKSFAGGVLGELYGSGDLVKNEDCSFYIGCPAGWDKNTREHYREIFESVGFPPAKIISESRAAMVSACQSKHLQVGLDILSKPVLVVDIGSSTTDFAYIMGGKEVEMQTAGEVVLGGGLMDEILLEESVENANPLFRKKIRNALDESEPWRAYCEFAARRLKEKYFSDEEYWSSHECKESLLIQYNRPVKLTLTMDKNIASKLLNKSLNKLGGKSFKEVFINALRDVKENITGSQPELIFLTGGVSKLPAIRDWCTSVFSDSVVISGSEPEFSVARGLAYCGRIDEDMRAFREDLEELTKSSKIEEIVRNHITQLYKDAVDCLIEPILTKVAMPIFDQWRSGEIRKLSDTDDLLEKEIGAFIRSDEARELLAGPITSWLKPVAEELEEYTVPICVNHRVPYTALSLKSYLSASDIDIKVDARNIFAVEEMTWLIDSLVTVLVGLIIAAIDVVPFLAGPQGVIVGVIASAIILILGKDKMEEKLLETDIPNAVRRLIPKGTFKSRMDNISSSVKQNFYESLGQDKNDEITNRMISEISAQIEQTLIKMAEVVEIPLG